MENRVSYYTSRKNVFVWLSALCMVAAGVLWIRNAVCFGCERPWLLTVLPVAAVWIFALILLFDCKEHIYRTSVPAFLFAVYFAVYMTVSGNGMHFAFLAWIAYLAIAAFYTVSISGRIKNNLFLIIVMAGCLAVLVYLQRGLIRSGDMEGLLPYLPSMLTLFGTILMLLSLSVYADGKYHPTWGDRSDGRKLRTISPFQTVANYIMPTRNGAANSIRDTIEITAMEKYIREKRKEGLTGFGITHVFLSAYVRCVAQYPAVNRFLSGQQVYSRDDDIQFCMVIKADMSTDGEESIAKIHLSPTDTAYDVYKKLSEQVDQIKNNPVGGSDFDKTAKLISLIPGVLLKFAIWLLKFLDYFGLLPKFLLEVSPFHASVFFTSMGSLGIPPITHHLYDFGNMPVFCAFGCKRHEDVIQDDGTVVHKKYVDYTFNTDERICDGFYFAAVLKYLKRLLAHPERLDNPPEEVLHDIR